MKRYQWGLLSGLGNHAISRYQGCHNLSREDSQRKIPRTDTQYRTAGMQGQRIRFAGITP